MAKFITCTAESSQSDRVGLRPRRSRPPEQVMRDALELAVTRTFGIDHEAFWGVTRGPPEAALARQIGMYLAHVAFGLSLTEVGQLFARDRTTVAHACSLVEDRRDNHAFDRAVDLLEGAINLLASPTAKSAPLPSAVADLHSQ